MLRTRIIPALLLHDISLVKTQQFKNYSYIGDPCNTVRIFNELEIDELFFLDISATSKRREPNLGLLTDIANECFMPLGYGGGINSIAQAEAIIRTGYEKVVVNSYALERPDFITELSNLFGTQAVIASIDVKKNIWGKYLVYSNQGKKKWRVSPIEWAKKLEKLGAGEILLTSIDREGTWTGIDLELVSNIARAVSIPVIAHGGAGKLSHISEAVNTAGASAVAVGSMVVYQKQGMGVLVSFPEKKRIAELFHD